MAVVFLSRWGLFDGDIYSREEHMCGGYGTSYVRAFINGTIPDIIRVLTVKLEEMAFAENDLSDIDKKDIFDA